MTKRTVLLALAGLVALLGAAGLLLVARFDPERYKPELAAWVKARTGRDLAIEGPLRFTLLPRPGVETGRLALSERTGSGTFASVERARLSLALWPLLRGDALIEDARLEGPKVALRVRADGTRNFDDLFARAGDRPAESSPSASDARARRVALDGLRIVGGEVQWQDERDGTDVRLVGLDAQFGHLEWGQSGRAKLQGRLQGSKPAGDLELAASGRYQLAGDGSVSLSEVSAQVMGNVGATRGLEASLRGDLDVDAARTVLGVRGLALRARTADGLEVDVAAPKLRLAREGTAGEQASATIRFSGAQRSLDARLALTALRAQGARVELDGVSLDGTLKAADAAYEAKLAGPVVLDLGAATIALPAVAGTLRLATPALGREAVVAPVTGSLNGDWSGAGSGNAKIATSLEGAALRASVDLEDWSRRRFRFALDAERLDLDRYLPASTANATSTPASPAPASAAPATATGGGPPRAGGFDLARLQGLDVSGTARVGSLTARGVKLEKLNLGVTARRGRIDVQPFAAALYGGTATGSGWVDTAARRWHLSQQIAGVQAAPFLRAIAKLDRLEGRGSGAVELEATGETGEALVRSLRGTARFTLADGAIKGVDLAELLRQANVALGSKSALEREARAGDRTAFSELSASFVVRDGIASTQDLAFRSDAAKATGGGRVDLVARTVDYKLDATLVGVSADIRNRVIARIGEVSIPVRVTGPIDSPKFTVDLGGFAAAAAANELNRRLQGGAEGRKDPVRDLLRGLFGR